MKVYLVKTYDYERILHGIFSTEERARAYITKNKLTETYIESEEVDEELVLPEPTRFLYQVKINKDGTLRDKRPIYTLDEEEDYTGSVFVWKDYVEVQTWAKDKEEALTKATRVHKYVLETRGWDTSYDCEDVDGLLRALKD
jgi:hypothetical protein